jgi:crossover junction endodeoxyribonuclease RuvC
MIVAFDPGLCGAVAFVSNDGTLIDCQDLPVIGEGTQRRIDAANLAAIIRQHNPTRAVIEQVSAMPGNGVSGMFRFGQSVGTIAGVVGALGLPVAWVSPSKSIETWPDKAALFARVKDHNRAEAALLALWSIGAKR